MKIIIHNDNVKTPCFDYEIKADIKENIDNSLNEIIKKIERFDNLEIIFIKDNLSKNHLEFLGIRLAFHIRFSEKFRNLPIVIISELSVFSLNKLNKLAHILFTDNIFLIKSEEIENFKLHKIGFDFNRFLEETEVNPPKDYLSHHSITNEWAVDVWSKLLKIDSDLILKNREKLEYMLYYKYLKAKFERKNLRSLSQNDKTKEIYGKVLLVDDKKEWGEIIESYLKKAFPKVKFDFLGGFQKDISIEKIEILVEKKIKEFNPDTIILDLRLLNEESQKIKEISGYQIMEFIKKINPAIQIILFTASKDSLILNSFFNQITGYIQKDSPFEKYEIKNSFENFNEIIMRALNKRYLKKIWQTTQNIENLRFKDDDFGENIKENANLVFKILNSNMKDSFVYAIYQMIKILEEVRHNFIKWNKIERCNICKIDNKEFKKASIREDMYEILKRLEIYDEEKKELVCQVIEFRNRKIHGGKKEDSFCKGFIKAIRQKYLKDFYEICYLILEKICLLNLTSFKKF